MLETPDTLPVGTEMQSYEIRKVLGRGGFGITYLAHDSHLEISVAIKEFFPSDLAYRDEERAVRAKSSLHQNHFNWGRDRFLMEARTLARFKHRNIVRVLTFFEMNQTAYMVMEYEQGKSLSTVLNIRKTLNEEEILSFVMPLLDGVGALHTAGFIHRDIKPDNIYIRNDNSPVLLDFGSARAELSDQTQAFTTLLTPGYAPFEQYYKNSRQGPWTDIYAVGAVMYHAVTGSRPLESTERSDTRLRGESDPLQSLTVSGAGKYSERFLKAVDRALMVLEKDRPQSIDEWKLEFTFQGEATKPLPPVETPYPAPAPSPASKGQGGKKKADFFYSARKEPQPFKPWLWLIECIMLVIGVLTQRFPVLSSAFTDSSPAPPFSFFEGVLAGTPIRFAWLGVVLGLSFLLSMAIMRPLSARINSMLLRSLLGLIVFNAATAALFWGMVLLFQELDVMITWF